MAEQEGIKKRKNDHLEITLKKNVSGKGITSGFERFAFIHEALPDINFSDIDISTNLFGKQIKTPFLLSSMTGGSERTFEINGNLAMAAESRGWALALGSGRAAIENPELEYTFSVRKYAPSIPIIANLGAVQLNYGYGIEECKRIVEMAEADALVLHLNSLQEVIQPEGDTNFAGLTKKIESLCKTFPFPVGVKEVGWGIHGRLAKTLFDAGVSFVDVAGAGGTSWSEVEKHRSNNPNTIAAAEALESWGIPTVQCLLSAKEHSANGFLIASGGLENGMEAAKAFVLGAGLAGYGRTILGEAVNSPDVLSQRLAGIELQLKVTMFGIGARSFADLKNSTNLVER
ncbi:type 2 isopentenyl-diphosphate Delta-isomerase [Bacillus massilinigeriensis]|uniref:type 2 isopentenyl-diphosphate Delta-isomerase n=1 Tax=Bacillus mediterraneensis TaxID=1805474 RepID=UPI0008F877F0|nr:type 2 isopentenyl-diphosphate Delta-isomerase [Bacillus mediterraneensis]